MLSHIEHIFSADGFMPHGMCYQWQTGVLSLHVVSDSLITLAYFSIPFTLSYFVRKRPDLQFNRMFVCFAVFIVACGTTHLMDIWMVWHPSYWLSGAIKAITALASVPTAILLIRLVPDALRLPSPAALQAAKDAAEAGLHENRRITAELRAAQGELMTSARRVGMAEIATSVPHNVGNVLNSVCVSADIIQSNLRDSKVDNLQQAVRLMTDRANDLSAFLSGDKKGRRCRAHWIVVTK